jgi:hypothetical protein
MVPMLNGICTTDLVLFEYVPTGKKQTCTSHQRFFIFYFITRGSCICVAQCAVLDHRLARGTAISEIASKGVSSETRCKIYVVS